MQLVIKPGFSIAGTCILNVKKNKKKEPHFSPLSSERKIRYTSPAESANKLFSSGFDLPKLH